MPYSLSLVLNGHRKLDLNKLDRVVVLSIFTWFELSCRTNLLDFVRVEWLSWILVSLKRFLIYKQIPLRTIVGFFAGNFGCCLFWWRVLCGLGSIFTQSTI